ncbi:uncharacterized protein METZ01_LOCUS283918 [marine metagenome]|uniref:N-acetyltransferase domain-containing protein n=1 Tax=marine metagenome TaxID=408172 RepID=A0A382L258_9ZZZZ
MEQLLLKMDDTSEVQVIAASAYNFRIELVKKVGKEDIPALIEISPCMADRFGRQALLTKTNIQKYFNSDTLPFIARFKGEIIGYIIGVPLEYFKQESWAHFDVNMGKQNTLYTYAFVVNSKYRGKGGYGKTLKRIYINWAKKQKYSYVTGHVEQGIARHFSRATEIVKVFSDWYGLKTPFEYYRRPLL